MKTLSIIETRKAPSRCEQDDIDGIRRVVVLFSDGKEYGAALIPDTNGWDCSLRLLSTSRTVTSHLRRRMVLEHLGLKSAITPARTTLVNNLRRSLLRYGLKLSKSHAWKYPTAANRGGYKVTNSGGLIVLGWNYDATLRDVEELLAAKVAEFRVE